VRPSGWLSSAWYIELPGQVEAGRQEGWIKFGQPGAITKPLVSYEPAVKPKLTVAFPIDSLNLTQ